MRTAVHREAEDKLDADFGKGKVETGKDSVAELVKECEDEGPAMADLLIACATRVGLRTRSNPVDPCSSKGAWFPT